MSDYLDEHGRYIGPDTRNMSPEQWRVHADDRFNAQDRDLLQINRKLDGISDLASLWKLGKVGWAGLVGLALFGGAILTIIEKAREIWR